MGLPAAGFETRLLTNETTARHSLMPFIFRYRFQTFPPVARRARTRVYNHEFRCADPDVDCGQDLDGNYPTPTRPSKNWI